jgi:hypothetical protein
MELLTEETDCITAKEARAGCSTNSLVYLNGDSANKQTNDRAHKATQITEDTEETEYSGKQVRR